MPTAGDSSCSTLEGRTLIDKKTSLEQVQLYVLSNFSTSAQMRGEHHSEALNRVEPKILPMQLSWIFSIFMQCMLYLCPAFFEMI